MIKLIMLVIILFLSTMLILTLIELDRINTYYGYSMEMLNFYISEPEKAYEIVKNIKQLGPTI